MKTTEHQRVLTIGYNMIKKPKKTTTKKTQPKEVALSTYVKGMKDSPEIQKLKEFLHSLPAVIRDNVKLSPEQILEITGVQDDVSLGLAADTPILCRGSDCDFAETCTYQKLKIDTRGYPCPEVLNLFVKQRSSPSLRQSSPACCYKR